VRPFVYLTLAGDGSTDRVLAATYVRAYRALPRYRSTRSPALWLHRLAYLVAVDELRRLSRDPMRRRPRAHQSPPRPAGAVPVEPEEVDVTAAALRHLAPDQRALAAMVDLEGFLPAAVADTFGTAPEVITARLASARRVLAAAAREADEGAAGLDVVASMDRREDPAGVLGGPAAGEEAEPSLAEDSFAVPLWAQEEPAPALGALVPLDQGPVTTAAVRADPPDPDPSDPDPPDLDEAHLSELVHRALAAVTVPPPHATFWTDLGRRLLAERDRPAARTSNPAARLTRAHPAEPSFAPSLTPPSGAVSTLADRAHQNRPRRRWRRPLLVAAAVIIVLA